tara:strand:+ start:265 stop:804 length:540 start_codon:yes stop_codon:yes gene_type:complete
MSTLDAIYVNLKILGVVKSYNRISTKKEYFEIVGPQASIVPLSLSRWYAGESRDDAIQKIQELYLSAADLLHSEEIVSAEKERLKDHIVTSLNGVIALQKTYEGDPTMIAKLEVVCDTAKCILRGQTVNTNLTRVVAEERLGVLDLTEYSTQGTEATNVFHGTESSDTSPCIPGRNRRR